MTALTTDGVELGAPIRAGVHVDLPGVPCALLVLFRAGDVRLFSLA